MIVRFFLALILALPAFAASPWTAYQNGVGGVTVRADSDTQIYADVSETTTFHYIADTELGGRLRRSDTITASFVMNFWMESGYDGDLRVGFFESQGGSLAATYAMGLRLMDPFGANPGTMRVYPTISYQGAVLFENALSLETNVNWGIGLTWTPTGGNHGQGMLSVTATNQSTLAVQTTSLHPSVDTLGFSVNAFGIVNGYHSAGDTERVKITVTDPTYSTISTPPALPANMRVFLLLGQSNARGNNGSETNLWPANTYESTNTFIFTDKEWGYARVNAPMHNDFGPEISFASAVSAKLGVPVGIVKVTRGGTALPAFLPAAADMYPQVTNAAISALALLTTPNLVGVLHVAGESDASNGTYAANYGANVATLMTALRTDLSRPTLTNIVSRLHNTAGLNEANTALIRTAQESYHWVNTDDLTLIDTIHFDTDSQMELGERMANEYFEILNGEPSARVATGQHYPIVVANPAALVPLNPNGRQLAILKNGGGLFWYDSTSLWPTNATYCFKPADYDGRWRPLSTVPGVTEKGLRDLASLDAGLALGFKQSATLQIGTSLTVGGSDVLTEDTLSTSQELRDLLSDENGTGVVLFQTNPTLINPTIDGDLQLDYSTSSPGVNEIGEMAAWQNKYAVGRGAVVHYDGTAETLLIGALASDTPTNGQVPKFNTGGTITWEDDSSSGVSVSGNGFARVTSGAFDASGVELSGAVTTSGSAVTTLANNAVGSANITNGSVSNSDLADVATDTIKGRSAAGTGSLQDLTALPFAFTGDVTRAADSNAQTIAADAVTSAKILNGEIVNADINASAGIDLSKIGGTGSITFPDDTRQTFNPGANAAGLNVGSHAGDPGTPSNGDIWYDSVANELTARINGANVALGAGGGGAPAGADTQIQFNDGGALGGDADATWNKTTNLQTINGAPGANTAPVFGLSLANENAASSGNQQYSGRTRWKGEGWGTTAGTSQDVEFQSYVVPVQGSTPSGNWILQSAIDGGAFATRLTVSSAGLVTSQGGLTAGGDVTATSSGAFTVSSRGRLQAASDGDWSLRKNDNATPATLIHALKVQVKTADYTVVILDSGTIIDNAGTTAQRTMTLPAAAAAPNGYTFTFTCSDSDGVKILSVGDDVIQYGASVTSAASSISHSAAGGSITLTCVNATTWYATSMVGTWTSP